MDGPIKVLAWIFFYAESMENFLDITVTLGAMAQALPRALALAMERAGVKLPWAQKEAKIGTLDTG